MQSSRPNRIAASTRAAALGFLTALVLAALANPAGAAKVTDVRVGLHKSFTRVVLETDTPAKYRIERGAEGEIQVYIDAVATSRRVSTRSQLLREVRLVPGRSETVARLRLRDAQVKLQELILLDPPRIVLDLRAAETRTADAPEPTPPSAKSLAEARAEQQAALAAKEQAAREKAAEAARQQAAREQAAREQAAAAARQQAALEEAARKQAELEQAAREQEALEQAAREQAALEQAAREKQAEHERAARERAAQLAAEAAADLEQELESTAAAGAAGQADQITQAGAADPGSAGSALAPAQPGESAGTTPPAPSRETDIARRVPPPPPPPARRPSPPAGQDEAAASDSALPGFLRDPVVLGGIGLALALLVGIVIHQRRGGREDDLISPVGESDQPFSFDEGVTDRVDATGERAGASPPSADESMYVPVPDVVETPGEPSSKDEETAAVNTEIGMDSVDTSFTPPPGAGAGADLMRMVQELERRLTIVEKRLEETSEAKERLERQVAAQTEELRVQRSAIARTQRALRSIARPDEEATEPVPKS